MRTVLVTTFYETLDYCFRTVLADMLGQEVLGAVFGLLKLKGIPREDVPSRFDEVADVLMKALGTSSRVLIHKTVTEMYGQYSEPLKFSFWDSFRDQLQLLKDMVTNNHLVPRREIEEPKYDSLHLSKNALT